MAEHRCDRCGDDAVNTVFISFGRKELELALCSMHEAEALQGARLDLGSSARRTIRTTHGRLLRSLTGPTR
jgi:hypothetical protein